MAVTVLSMRNMARTAAVTMTLAAIVPSCKDKGVSSGLSVDSGINPPCFLPNDTVLRDIEYREGTCFYKSGEDTLRIGNLLKSHEFENGIWVGYGAKVGISLENKNLSFVVTPEGDDNKCVWVGEARYNGVVFQNDGKTMKEGHLCKGESVTQDGHRFTNPQSFPIDYYPSGRIKGASLVEGATFWGISLEPGTGVNLLDKDGPDNLESAYGFPKPLTIGNRKYIQTVTFNSKGKLVEGE